MQKIYLLALLFVLAFFLSATNMTKVNERSLNQQVAETDVDLTLQNLVMSPVSFDETVADLIRSSVENEILLVPLKEALTKKILLIAKEDETFTLELKHGKTKIETDAMQHKRCSLWNGKGEEIIRSEMLIPSKTGDPMLVTLVKYRCT